MVCASCRSPIAEGQNFCSGCGQPVTLACPGCGTTVASSYKFCSACGSAVRAPQQAPARALPPGTGRLEAPGQTGDRRVVTVLFTDVSGFTAMSERLDPEEVTEVINAFFKVLTEPIYQYGGVVDKYIGDAIMALFGAPVAHEDDPARAVMAAWEMQKAARSFADKLEGATGIRLRVRIGINTGLVVAGSVGGQQRQDYTVIGDTVNLAQRMESSAPVGGILASHETYRQTRALFEFDARDPVQVKGRADPVLTYEVLRPRPQPRVALRPRAALVGRTDESGLLAAAIEAAAGGVPQLVEVVGDAGTGKSRLSAEVCQRAGLEPVIARCQSFHHHIPYAMLARLLEAWLDLPVERTPEIALERLQTAFAGLPGLPEPERAVVFCAHLLHQDLETPELAALTPQQRRTAAFKALSDTLLALSRQAARPVVLVLDDVQWADEASRQWLPEFLQHLVGVAEGSRVDADSGAEQVPIAVIATYRPDETAPDFPDIPHLARTHIAVRPLAADEARSLLAGLLDLPAAPAIWEPELQNLSRSLLARAEGNPYFLEELVAGLVDGGVLVRDADAGRWRLTRAGALSLPPTVNGVVASRLDRLSPQLRSTLQLASVLGRTFSVETLGRIRPSDEAAAWLAELTRGGFVVEEGTGEYAFARQIVQEVAYSSMLLATRKELHVRAALALEEAKLLAPEPLARHWMIAGEKAKAARYLWLSGDQAKNGFANQEAIDAYKQALACLDGLEAPPPEPRPAVVLLGLAEVETIAGAREDALAHLDQALPQAADDTERARMFQGKGAAWERLGQFPTALAAYQEAMGALGSTAPLSADRLAVAARIRIDTAFLHFRLGDQARCIALCSEALKLLADQAALRDKALAHSILGLCLFQQSRYAEAAGHHRYALSLREQAEDWYGVASSRNNLGLIGSHTTAWAEAIDHFSAALQGFARVGDLGKVSLVEGNLGMLLCRKGDLDRAESHLRHALEIHQRLKSQFGVGSTLAMLGLVQIEAGQPAMALALLGKALEGFEATGAAEQQAEIHQLMGRAHLDRGHIDEAAAELERALALAGASGEKVQEGVTSRLLARVAQARGDLATAQTQVEAALAVLEPTESQHELARALVDAADIWRQAERTGDADDALARARALFEALEAKIDLARLASGDASPATSRS